MQPSIDDAAWFAARLDAGDTIAEIGQAAGVSRQTASAWLKRHGLRATNPRVHERPPVEQMRADYERTGSIRALAAEYDISPAAMRTWLFEAGIDPIGAAGRPRFDVDVDDIRARRARGDTWGEIAKALGVAAETVRRRVEEPTP